MKTKTFKIPFEHIRAFLPPDGQREVIWHGTMNKWKKNRDSFERHETAEIAFGRAIRAKKGDRKSEESLSPGISTENGYIRLQGGWAAHKAVSRHPDYFDGNFWGDVHLIVKNGHVDSDLTNFNFTWRASFVVKIVDFTGIIRNIIIGIIRSKVRNVLLSKLREEIDKKIEELMKQFPNAEILRDKLKIVIKKNAIEISISYN
ncbi:MAG: hypothetical protein PF795_09445 [Kiritimatiellae bacterium]|jgi:DNA primase large subunit|nr:hypothetical protein [Kiritimatiellia bacterium]